VFVKTNVLGAHWWRPLREKVYSGNDLAS
jgi:hypothetical protein